MSCTGSLEIVDLPRPGEQLTLDLGLESDQLEDAPPPGIDTIALFQQARLPRAVSYHQLNGDQPPCGQSRFTPPTPSSSPSRIRHAAMRPHSAMPCGRHRSQWAVLQLTAFSIESPSA
ncbi:hypothetical protein [Streptomyces flaveolus]|uniref:hypothetical protein n=1 Tax=Streptomyces flaveolus TaxID=67297 RepID=UPI00382CCD4D